MVSVSHRDCKKHGLLARTCVRCFEEKELATLGRARALVNKQAEDGGFWFIAMTAPEAYLQQALRRLHAAVKGDEE